MNDRVPALLMRGVTVSYQDRAVFSSLDLEVPRGASVALVGPSGLGKTTLLNTVIGAVPAAEGSILVVGHEVVGATPSALAEVRGQDIGIVFQHGELIGELSPVENVALPALIAGRTREEAVATATELLTVLGVPLGRDSADELSGGERQRTALARALVNRPGLVLADEPTGALDPATRDRVAEVIFAAPRTWGCGLLVVTHDAEVAARADLVVDLADLTAAASVGAGSGGPA